MRWRVFCVRCCGFCFSFDLWLLTDQPQTDGGRHVVDYLVLMLGRGGRRAGLLAGRLVEFQGGGSNASMIVFLTIYFLVAMDRLGDCRKADNTQTGSLAHKQALYYSVLKF